MRDVSHKTDTLRVAVAVATLHSEDSFPKLLEAASADKGDALQISRIAGILAAKNTPMAIPLCHTIPILHAECFHHVDEHEIRLEFTCTTRAQTGVEIESLHAIATAAVTLYDVLKPHTKSLEIRSIRLDSKSGGKSDHRRAPESLLPVTIHVLADDGGVREIVRALEASSVVPDLREAHAGELSALLAESSRRAGIDIVVANLQAIEDWHADLREAVDVPMPGIAQAVRHHGLQRHPWAMFTTLITGWIGETLVLTAPSDVQGASEFATALIPYILTARRHDLD